MLDFINIFSSGSLAKKALSGSAGLLLVILAGCASNDYPPVPEAQKDVYVDYDYVIGAGDTFEIFVWGIVTTSGQYHEQ